MDDGWWGWWMIDDGWRRTMDDDGLWMMVDYGWWMTPVMNDQKLMMKMMDDQRWMMPMMDNVDDVDDVDDGWCMVWMMDDEIMCESNPTSPKDIYCFRNKVKTDFDHHPAEKRNVLVQPTRLTLLQSLSRVWGNSKELIETKILFFYMIIKYWYLKLKSKKAIKKKKI